MQRQVLSIALLLSLPACTSTDDPAPLPTVRAETYEVSDFTTTGPWGIGMTQRHLGPIAPLVEAQWQEEATDDSKPPVLDVVEDNSVIDVWYPIDKDIYTSQQRGRDEFDGLHGAQVREAPLAAGGPWPVLVFSHGLAAVRDQSTFLVHYLVSHGYVVVSADHHPSLITEVFLNLDDSSPYIITSALRRPFEIFAQIDQADQWNADPDDRFYGQLDTNRVIVSGHSFGGYSALIVSGATADFDKLITFCEEGDDDRKKSLHCDEAGNYDGSVRSFRFDDPRIAGIIPYTPGATPLFAGGGLADMKIPSLIMGGTSDTTVEPDPFLHWMYDDIRAPKIYAEIPGADHLDFSQLCQIGNFGGFCGAANVFSVPEMLRMIRELSLAFTDSIVRDNATATNFLQDSAVNNRYPGLIYREDFE